MDSTNGEQDIMRIWSLLTEVSEQLTQNRSVSISIHNLTSGVKSQSVHSQTGFVLRRFNLDQPKAEVYEAELERMNTAMTADNQTLQNDNRQLNALIREYEQTLENVMSQFRARAYEVQQRELALLREYESAIVQRETEALDAALSANNSRSESLARLGRLLRALMKKFNGEDVSSCEAAMAVDAPSGPVASTSHIPPPPSLGPQPGEGPTDDGKLHRRIIATEWALERESELARLERENEELRILLRGVLNAETVPMPAAPLARRPGQELAEINEDGRASPALSVASSTATVRPGGRKLGGPPGTVGPFGSYKMRTQLNGQ
ncbi:uncharacterized protein B0H18DRAFT_892721 [Fomitopsis serialis]|uniref:uncharacterized protein n=1 Tax=Fomitopsis serialis TaxID=139415 RepID=UPI002007B109|nr:uncharacterized protein B0H18DRAFT_892721 [Neoantrodia serialis]KAH9911501.1 hypothetical protein B0H18DRAFT_892721 [Neoantrodia serialis]